MKSKLKFQSYDGYKLEGVYQSSSLDKVFGAALFVHGITSEKDELGFHSDMALFLAEKGIASLRFDYRYHGKNESSLEELTLCGILNDIDSAFSALEKQTAPSTNNYFLIATSFGGGLGAYWASNIAKNRLRKVFLNAPVIDYEDDVLKRNGLIKNGILADKGVKQLNKKGYVDSSDIHFGRGLINELSFINGIIPLQALGDKVVIFHGSDDEDVPLSSSKKFKSSTTELKVIDGVGHGFGIDIDEDLTHPETKKIHQKIYESVWQIMGQEISR